jgi:hypothetical protein
VYLQEARRHERVPEFHPDQAPNRDIQISDSFIREHEPLLTLLGGAVLNAALQTPGAVDNDIREALDALIRTQRTLESGLYYETRPNNPVAGAIAQRVQAAVQEFREAMTRQSGMNTIRDKDILGVLVFLQRVELQHNNGRRLGRAFQDFLRSYFEETVSESQQQGRSPLIIS